MDRVFSGRWFNAAAVALLAASVILVYSNSFHAAFQLDDIAQIIDNRKIESLSNIPKMIFKNRGVSLATFALNYSISARNVFGYHVFNTAVHVINAALAYFLLCAIFEAMGRERAWSRRVAFFSSLLFAIHPVQTESVTYIVQRMESLSSLFYLAALLLLFKACPAAGVKRYLIYAVMGLLFALGFYSKETAITMPAMILLTDVFFAAPSSGGLRTVISRWPMYALLLVLFLFFSVSMIKPLGGRAGTAAAQANQPAQTGVHAFKEPPSAGFGVQGITPKEYLLTEINAMPYYMALLAVPVNQNADYQFPLAKGFLSAPEGGKDAVLNLPVMAPALSLAITAALLAPIIRLFFRHRGERGSLGRATMYFALWFFIILSPTSSFIPILDVMAEHRLYLPSLGFLAIMVVSIEALFAFLFTRPAGRKA